MALLQRAIEKAVVEFNRTGLTKQRLAFLHRDERRFYRQDGLYTHHAHAFIDEPRFQGAYGRAVQAAGYDYRIHWRVHTLLWAAELAARAEGAFVECGTGRGFMASAICSYLGWTDRPFYLLDTFRSTVPDSAGEQGTGRPVSPCYARSPEATAQNFTEWPGARLVVGRIPETLTAVDAERIAFLHVDLNHSSTEEKAVRHFWPHIVRGGIVVFDDYGFDGFLDNAPVGPMVDRLAGELGWSVYASPSGQGIVVK